MELICDDREHKICNLAKDKYDNVYVEHLIVGDFLIGFKKNEKFIPLVIIERKTWADLSASIKDGRVHNVQKLLSYREETGARIAYLIEGSVPKNITAQIEGIPYKSLRAHLDHLLYRDGVIELHTTGPADSLRRLLEFGENIRKFAPEIEPTCDGLAAAKVKIVLTDEQISDRIWSAFEGISLASARAFRHLNISSLYKGEISEETLAGLQIGARKFGPARASAIIASLNKEQTLENLLCAVPRISTKRARGILNCLVDGVTPIPIKDLFTRWDDFRPILEKKLGTVCLANIEKYFHIL